VKPQNHKDIEDLSLVVDNFQKNKESNKDKSINILYKTIKYNK